MFKLSLENGEWTCICMVPFYFQLLRVLLHYIHPFILSYTHSYNDGTAIRSNFRFSFLSNVTKTCRPEEPGIVPQIFQIGGWPALPLSHSCPQTVFKYLQMFNLDEASCLNKGFNKIVQPKTHGDLNIGPRDKQMQNTISQLIVGKTSFLSLQSNLRGNFKGTIRSCGKDV